MSIAHVPSNRVSGHRSARAMGVMLVAVALLLAACGSSSKSSTNGSGSTGGTPTTGASAGTQTKDATLAAMVPAKLKAAGVVKVAADASYPPNEFFAADNKTVQGMDVDLAKAIGDILGVKFQVENVTFANIIPGLGTRYDLGMSSFTDNTDREKTVDMVTYFTAGESFMALKGKNTDVTDISKICGKKVAVEAGTVELDDANAQSAKCTGAKVNVLSFPTQDEVNLALNSGRADIAFADTPVNDYQIAQSKGAFAQVGKSFGFAPYGIAVPKGAEYKGLADAILGAVKKLAANGTYKTILAKWGISAGAITDFKINGANG